MRATLCAREGCGRPLTIAQLAAASRYCSRSCARMRPDSYRSIGEALGVSRQRVQQLYKAGRIAQDGIGQWVVAPPTPRAHAPSADALPVVARHVYRRKGGEPAPPPAARRRCACGRAVTSASNRRCRVCLTEAALRTWRYVESAE